MLALSSAKNGMKVQNISLNRPFSSLHIRSFTSRPSMRSLNRDLNRNSEFQLFKLENKSNFFRLNSASDSSNDKKKEKVEPQEVDPIEIIEEDPRGGPPKVRKIIREGEKFKEEKKKKDPNEDSQESVEEEIVDEDEDDFREFTNGKYDELKTKREMRRERERLFSGMSARTRRARNIIEFGHPSAETLSFFEAQKVRVKRAKKEEKAKLEEEKSQVEEQIKEFQEKFKNDDIPEYLTSAKEKLQREIENLGPKRNKEMDEIPDTVPLWLHRRKEWADVPTNKDYAPLTWPAKRNDHLEKFLHEKVGYRMVDYGEPERDKEKEEEIGMEIAKERFEQKLAKENENLIDDYETRRDAIRDLKIFERQVVLLEKRVAERHNPRPDLNEKYIKNEPTIRYGKWLPITPLGPYAESSNHWDESVKKHRTVLSRISLLALYALILLIILAYFFPDRFKKGQDYIEFRIKTGFRFLRCAYTAMRIGFDYKSAMRAIEKLGETATTEEKEALMSKAHTESAQLLLKLFESNEGIFIKAGQHMSALGYIIPLEYTTAMEPLFERAPYKSFEDIVKVFKEEFGATPQQMFEEFDTKPTSSASMAQVHKARYNGQDVAVKIQHLGLSEQCVADVRTIEIMVNAMAWVFPEFKLKWLVDEFNRNLPNELDFVQEARNAVKAQKNFEQSGLKRAKTPEIIWDRTSAKVLCMEWIDGVSLYNHHRIRQMGISTDQVAKLLSEVFNDQIFKHGFVHCDPHPGNVFVRKTAGGFEMVLLDNGLYRQYDDEFRLDYANLWWSIYNADPAGIQKYTKKLAKSDSYELFASMLTSRALNKDKLAGSFKSYANIHTAARGRAEMAEMQRAGAGRVIEISQILQTVPPELLLLFKTNDLLRSVTATLVSPEASFQVLARTMEYCLWTINKEELHRNGGLLNQVSALWQEWLLSLKLRSFGLLQGWWFTSRLTK